MPTSARARAGASLMPSPTMTTARSSVRWCRTRAETADAVILVDRVDRVADAIRVGRRALHIARQSVLVGIALSLLAMGVPRRATSRPCRGQSCKRRSTSSSS
jgi:hypothetical protein